MKSTIQIGDQVTFKDYGNTTREGRIVGREFVEDPRRTPGEHFVIATLDFDVIDIHRGRIGAKL